MISKSKDMNKNLDEMTSTLDDLNTTVASLKNASVEEDSQSPIKPVETDSVFTDEEPEQVAVLGLGSARKAAKEYIDKKITTEKEIGSVVDEALSGKSIEFEQVPLEVNGVVQTDKYGNPIMVFPKDAQGKDIVKEKQRKIVQPIKRKEEIDEIKQQTTPEPTPNQPDELKPIDTDPVSEDLAARIERKRQEFILDQSKMTDEARAKHINIGIYDDDSLKATIIATSNVLNKSKKFQTTTVNDLKKQALELGLPEKRMEERLAGLPFESPVGKHALATRVSALVYEYRSSSEILDLYFERAAAKTLSDIDKFNLLQQLKTHQILEKELLGVSQDVATTMNTFKKVKDYGPALKDTDFQAILDSNLSDRALERLAKLYMHSPNRSIKNKILSKQEGGFSKLADAAYYTFMSNILSDVKTWSENLVGSAIHGVLISTEDLIISGMNSARKAMGMKTTYDQQLSDHVHRAYALLQNFNEAWVSAKYVIRTGNKAGFKAERRHNPLSAENFSNTSFQNPFSRNGKEFYKTGELKDTWVGNSLDAAGFVQSVPMRFLGAGDEIIGVTLARGALHQKATEYVRRRLGELADEGVEIGMAKKRVAKEVADWVDEMPADVFAHKQEVKDLIQFTYNWDKTKLLDKTYANVNKFLSLPVIRYFVPFSNTLTKILDQGTSRIPILNFMSPQFYKDWSRGGYYKDRARARLLVGGTFTTTAYFMTADGKVTGGGPTDYTQKQALQNTGWQPYSFVINKTGMSEEALARLKKYTDVSFDGERYYVSYQRFDMLAQLFAASADFHDIYKHYDGDPNSNEVTNLLLATAGASSQYLSNLPIMQFTGEIVSLTQGNYENPGERWADLIERIAERGLTTAALTVPVASMALQGSATAHIARTIDPEQPSNLPDYIQIGDTLEAKRAYQTAKKRMIAKIPFLRGDLDMAVDNLGRPIYQKNTAHQHYLNTIPFISRTDDRRSKTDELLVQYNYGISKPSPKIGPVSMSDEIYTNYKRMYGQQVKLNVLYKDRSGKYVTNKVNLEKAIQLKIEEQENKFKLKGIPMEKIPVKVMQKIVANEVAKYRAEAKKIMFGELVTPTDKTKPPYYSKKYDDKDAMYPEFSDAYNAQQNLTYYGQ